jgi:hypothetical protein
VNLIYRENSFWKETSPLKIDPFQNIIKPPEAPTEGRNSNLLNFFGRKFLKYCISKCSFFVS